MLKQVDKILDDVILKELKTFPNQGILLEIIEKNKTGQIFKLSGNAFLIIENCPDPFVFIVGQLTDEGVSEVISFVTNLDFPMVYCHPQYHPLFLKRGWNFHLRTELSLKRQNKVLQSNHSLKIQPIKTIELFKKCIKYKERSELYGSDENFLAYGIGYALCNDSYVVSEAYANIGGGYAEISITTHPDHKLKGYGTLIVSHLINECERSQIIPKWSCNVNNKASLYTGLKLGFEIDNYYTLLVPDCGNVLCENLVTWLKNNDYTV